MKSILKNFLVRILGSQVRRLRKRRDFKLIGVVGSIGKTSTKLAIAKMLSSEKRVRYQEGNYNDIVSVPLVFFGQSMPALWNALAWLGIILKNELQILKKFPYDAVVVELGTDAPGQISRFRKYMHLDMAVVTAVAPEHMEFFETLDKVAEEEWSAAYFSDLVLANRDLNPILPEGLDHKKIIFYGKEFGAAYKIEDIVKEEEGFSFSISYEGKEILHSSYKAVSEVQLYSVCAAVAVSHRLKINPEKIKGAIDSIESFSGRMQKLKGINGSIIIDDTYNASPDAVKIALNALYEAEAPQRIAILGMMNELGKSSPEAHKEIGKYCDPKKIGLLVTIGKHANEYLAPAAESKGVEVYRAKNSIEAGLYLKDKVQKGAVILAKGSQNGVFAEEALKPLLADKDDEKRLVRQDSEWQAKKARSFVI